MIELATNPSEATRERLAEAVSWARRLYGTTENRCIEVVASLPEPITFMSPSVVGKTLAQVEHSRTPAVQLTSQCLRVHPALCKASVPRYVLRYVVVMGLIRSTTRTQRLYALKRSVAPYPKTAPEWLLRKGYGEDTWDI